MNRTLGFGLALFFAILSIAVLGNGTEATAGSDCGGCHADSGCNGGCGGWFKHRNRCHGGLFRHLRGCHSSCSGSNCSGSSCHSSDDCHSSKDCGGCHSRRCHGGLFARLKARRCHGRCHETTTAAALLRPNAAVRLPITVATVTMHIITKQHLLRSSIST